METVIKKELRFRIVDFIDDVIKHRKRLITLNKSSINKMKALKYIEKLERNRIKFRSDVAASAYLMDHLEEIRYLIKVDDFEKNNKLNQLLAAAEPLSKL